MKGLGDDGRYWLALGEGRLELPRCVTCQHWHWPAPFRCPDCGSAELAWHEVVPSGRIFTWARAQHPFAGTEGLGLPYTSVLVELPDAGGIRLLGLLDGDTEPRIGAPVTGAVTTTHAFDRDVPAWRWSVTP